MKLQTLNNPRNKIFCAGKTSKQQIEPGKYCGWETEEGRRTAVLVSIEGDTANVWLCETQHGPPTDPPIITKVSTKQIFRVCGRKPEEDAVRCKFHGGATPRGKASPHYKHGRNSKYDTALPDGLRQEFEQSLRNPSGLKEELAMLDLRLAQLVGRIMEGEGANIYDQMITAVEEFRRAVRQADPDAIKETSDRIFRVATKGKSDFVAWREYLNTLDIKRQTEATAAKVDAARRTTIPKDQAYLMLEFVENELLTAVRTNASPEVARRILAAFSMGMRRVRGTGSRSIEPAN